MVSRNPMAKAIRLTAIASALLITGSQFGSAQDYRLPRFPQDLDHLELEDVNGPDLAFDWSTIYETPNKQAFLIDDTMLEPIEDTPYRVYVGPNKISNWPGTISFGPGLGFIKVAVPIVASGNIFISEGTYLTAEDRLGCGGFLSSRETLEVGNYLNVLGDISVDGTLSTGWDIRSEGKLSCLSDLESTGTVFACDGIEVGGGIRCAQRLGTDIGDIKAGESIKAGEILSDNVEAGENILVSDWIICDDLKAGGGITTGWDISASGTISCGRRILAGVDPILDGSDPETMTVTCSKLLSGEVAYGILVETGGHKGD